MGPKRRGVGFCTNRDCETFGRGYYLPDPPVDFECPCCLRMGRLVRERGMRQGGSGTLTEVRVEFSYDRVRDVFRECARLRDDRVLGRHAVYTFQSPLVRSRSQALRIARVILTNGNRQLDRRARAGCLPSRAQLMADGWAVLA